MGMRRALLAICGVVCLSLVVAAPAFAQQPEEKGEAGRPPMSGDEAKPPPDKPPQDGMVPKDKKPKVPKRGDFDAGDLKPMFDAGLLMNVKLSSVVDFSLVPVFVWQSGSAENLQAVQIPTSLILAIGSLVKVSADFGIYTGDDFSFRPSNGGRIALG